MSVEFEEDNFKKYQPATMSNVKEPFFIDFLIRKKLASSKEQAQVIVAVTAVLILVVSAFLFGHYVLHIGGSQQVNIDNIPYDIRLKLGI